MKKQNTTRQCKGLRDWLFSALTGRINLDADWIQKHIATCPRCQKRLTSVSRVNLALTLLKASPHKLDLLMRANQKTVAVLNHGLRDAPKAQELKTALPKPTMFERMRKYQSLVANVAACIAILLMMKTGIFSTARKAHDHGTNALKHYYSSQVGEDLADEIFTS